MRPCYVHVLYTYIAQLFLFVTNPPTKTIHPSHTAHSGLENSVRTSAMCRPSKTGLVSNIASNLSHSLSLQKKTSTSKHCHPLPPDQAPLLSPSERRQESLKQSRCRKRVRQRAV